MATISNATTLGVPGTADSGDISQDALSTSGTPSTAVSNRYTDYATTDTDGTLLDSGGLTLNERLTVQDIQFWASTMQTDNGVLAATPRFTGTDSVFNVMVESSANTIPTARGLWTMTNMRVIRRTLGGLYFFGNTTTDGAWRTDINGLILESYGATLVLHTGGLDVDNSTLNNVQLVGNSTAQLNARSAQFGFVPGNVADNQNFDNAGNYGGVDYGYSIRFVHQLVPDGNVADNDAVPSEWALYTSADLRNIVAPGSDFASVDGAQSVIQINRNAAVWLLDPNMGNLAGEANAGRNMLVGYHNTNPPTGGNPAEIRTLISDRQTFQDAAGDDVTGTKVAYNSFALAIPNAYARTTPPAALANNEVTVNDANYNGVMVQSQRDFLSVQTGASTAAINSRSPGVVANQVAPLRTDITRTVRNFRYDYPYETTLVYDPARMTGLVAATATPNEGVDLNEFLNGSTATTDFSAGITDFADEYVAVRSFWYNDATPPGTMPITPAGTSLTYNRNINYQLTGSTSFTGTGAVVVSDQSPTLTGTVVDRIYGTNTVSWNTIRFPDGIGVSGGAHNGFGSLSGRNWRALADLSLIFPRAAGTYGFDDVFGNITISDGATVTVASDNNIVVDATAAQIAMFTIDNSLGLGTFAFNEVPELVNFQVRVQPSAVFGGTSRNFDGYVTIVENVSGTRSVPSNGGPFLIDDTNRDSVLFSIDNTSIPAGTTYEVYTTGQQWNVARTTFDNTGTNGNITAQAIADNLFQNTVTSPSTITRVVFNSVGNTLDVTADAGGLLSEANGNATAGQIRQFAEYARAIALRGATTDAIRFVSANAIAPTFNTDVVTGALPTDNVAITWQGGAIEQGSTGDLGIETTITARVWGLSAGAAGAQPSAIGAVVRQSFDDAGLATRQDVIDNTEPLL